MIDRDAALAYLKEHLSEKRLRHSLGCAKTAAKLAVKFGADVEKAYDTGLLHDITREICYEDQLKICAEYGIIVADEERVSAALLHAPTGAAIADKLFHPGADVCSAIRWHTVAKPDMTPLEMSVCLADYIEPTRHFKTVEKLRETAARDVYRALLDALSGTIIHIVRDGEPLCTQTVRARNWLLQTVTGNRGVT
ncbi:MAG: HD domain-containing protein [Clostridiales bacterium]|jgi:nicotinate-nucleotide adenylyltransferase|nr:HD domain-containing protein [Clostridiales bacterium]